MEGELKHFIKVWLAVSASLSYCYIIAKIIPKGRTRLLTILPVICLFLDLPLHLSSIHLGGTTAFFISWLANFKILLFAFAMVAALARTLLGIELEPQFDEPYLSTSLQDFWGRRWNIMVTSILRPTVYEPVLDISARLMGRKWDPLPAVLGTYVVSAVMHELIFYYLGRVKPTWEITWFFLLHGGCLMAEISLKKKLKGKCLLPPVISGPLTVGFVMGTSFWLFFPQLLRCKFDIRAFEEYAAVGAFVKDISRALTFTSFNATRD